MKSIDGWHMDDGAFGRAIAGERKFLMAWARKKFGAGHDAAEDYAQEAMLRAWQARAIYDDRNQIRSWLMTIMNNYIISQKRRAWRLVFTDDQMTLDSRSTPPDQEDSVFFDQAMDIMIRDVPPTQVDSMLEMAQGNQYHEVAAILGIPDGTIKSRVARGRAALRKALAAA